MHGQADVLYELSIAAKLERHAYPYIMRHTFARIWLVQNAMNLDAALFTLTRLMGHTSTDMTLKYIKFFASDLQFAHGLVAPGDRF